MSDPIGSIIRGRLTKAQSASIDTVLDTMPGARVVNARASSELAAFEIVWNDESYLITVGPEGDRGTGLIPHEEQSAVALTNLVGTLLVPEVPVEERAETLRSFIMDVATARVGDEDAEDPYESLGSKVIWEAARLLEALENTTAQAKMLVLMDATENGDRDLLEGMIELMPSDAPQGRARSTALWLTKAVPMMRQAGIPPDEIAAVHERGPTMLSVGAGPAQVIAEADLKPEERKEQFRELLTDMRTKSSREVTNKWTPPRIPPLRIQFVHRDRGGTVVVALEHKGQEEGLLNRLGNWYEVAEDLWIPLTAADLKLPKDRLIKRVILGDNATCRHLYDYIARKGPSTIIALCEGTKHERNDAAIALETMTDLEMLEQSIVDGVLVWSIPEEVT